ncbi:hypothetical protein [Merdimonas faecis]|uniref:hypothetical protein n=1 Tax=Merdimonas faecis TaxID=1653435 RepID=UPI00086372F6|nr:hypothetical protein [Merdimonas faecis]
MNNYVDKPGKTLDNFGKYFYPHIRKKFSQHHPQKFPEKSTEISKRQTLENRGLDIVFHLSTAPNTSNTE